MKITTTLLFLLLSIFSYSQNSKPEIIKKDIPISNEIDIIDYHNANQKTIPIFNNTYNSRIKVYFNNRFYSSDTLQKIKNLDQYKIEIIKIPKNITEDITDIIYVRKKDEK